MKEIRLILVFLLIVSTGSSIAAPLGTAFTYQGRLTDGASPANGIYHFVFELFDASVGGTFLNDNEREDLTVSNGLFTVVLDFGPTAFTSNARWLQTKVQTNNGGGFTILSPRQQLYPTPYALFSPTAGGVTDGAITSDMLGVGSVTTLKLADGSVTSSKLAPGTVVTNILATTNNLALGTTNVDGRLDVYRTGIGTPSIQLLGAANQISTFGDDGLEQIRLWGPTYGELLLRNNLPGNQTAVSLSANGSAGGFLSLGNSNGAARAELSGANAGGLLNLFAANGIRTAGLNGSIGQISLFSSVDGAETLNLFNFGGGNLTLANFPNHTNAVSLSSGGSGGAFLRLNNSTAQERVLLYGQNSGGTLEMKNSSNALSVDIRSQFSAGNTAAWVGLNDNGAEKISFAARNGASGAGGLIGVRNSTGQATLLLTGDNGSGTPVLSLNNASGSPRVNFFGANAGGSLTLQDGSGAIADMNAENGIASLELREASGTFSAKLRSQSDGGSLALHNHLGLLNVDLRGQFSAGNTAAWVGLNDNGSERISFAARNGSTGAGGLIGLRNGSGVATVLIAAEDGTGRGRVTTSVLEITGGSDLSEQFDVRTQEDQQLEPGMIVSIDPVHPGELVVSTKAYDRTVAGIVSGAGGVSPGMLMGQRGSAADGKHPVALTGRVYCLADASAGAIQAGDLLTSSQTPGHAMKVQDHARAQGAIIGKAMTGLAAGKGLVLTLVSLQ